MIQFYSWRGEGSKRGWVDQYAEEKQEGLIYLENNQYSICPGPIRICAKQFHSFHSA